mmetsp:Transcript_17300/g.16507  ORF Transcript_17300/g.16507 Transcript_17300/m.16507 type:complete len:109 (-) Transcript_17300:200-526(-)
MAELDQFLVFFQDVGTALGVGLVRLGDQDLLGRSLLSRSIPHEALPLQVLEGLIVDLKQVLLGLSLLLLGEPFWDFERLLPLAEAFQLLGGRLELGRLLPFEGFSFGA